MKSKQHKVTTAEYWYLLIQTWHKLYCINKIINKIMFFNNFSDPPGAATLVYEPTRVVKQSSVTLRCSVEDVGRPETTTYHWMRGTYRIQDVTTANWTIDPVTLETESNFTCMAYNKGGEGERATVYIDVFGKSKEN